MARHLRQSNSQVFPKKPNKNPRTTADYAAHENINIKQYSNFFLRLDALDEHLLTFTKVAVNAVLKMFASNSINDFGKTVKQKCSHTQSVSHSFRLNSAALSIKHD